VYRRYADLHRLITSDKNRVKKLIDLHCHLLPGIDDGSKSLEMSLAMARMASSDGITTIACTPHILPGVYNNTGPQIRAAVAELQQRISEAGIPITLITGADVHIAPDLGIQLRQGRALTLNDSRYFLLEPPHHLLPPRLEDLIFGLQAAGYVPVLTHPERLSWIEGEYDLIKRFVNNSVLMQITAGSLLGQFGRRPRYWAERMLDEGLCHLLATDAHNTDRRAPRMSEAHTLVAQRLGEEEAANLVQTRPQGILNDLSPAELPGTVQPRAPQMPSLAKSASTWSNIVKRVRRMAAAQ
jgi:protein-tyrosine phosphatase